MDRSVVAVLVGGCLVSATLGGISGGLLVHRLSDTSPSRSRNLKLTLDEQSKRLVNIETKLDQLAAQRASQGVASSTARVRGELQPVDVRRAVQLALQTEREEVENSRRWDEEEAARPSDDELQAHAEGERLVDDALRQRRWGESQAQTLRDLASRMTGSQLSELVSRLASAVDEDELVVTTDGPPF